jgi:hypothetical protein
MKLYWLFLKESVLYLSDRLQALFTALSVVYSAPVDVGLTRRERRRLVTHSASPTLVVRPGGTGKFFPPALGTIAF